MYRILWIWMLLLWLGWLAQPVRGGATVPPCPCNPNEPEPKLYRYYFPMVRGE